MKREMRRAIDAGGFERPRFVDIPESDITSGCVMVAQVRTSEDPEEKAVRTVVADLKKSGWSQETGWFEDYGSLWSLKRGEWMLDVMTGSVTEALAADAPPDAPETQAFTGMIVTAIDHECARAAVASAKASPSPSPS
ncbi:hypothetical protein [Streptomyces sp. NPDC005012]|uniref:hypothetical protein n=1 Tax=Streptomyces sp. NPDC005012 TaxID=3154558 RepID=UPI0033A7807A